MGKPARIDWGAVVLAFALGTLAGGVVLAPQVARDDLLRPVVMGDDLALEDGWVVHAIREYRSREEAPARDVVPPVGDPLRTGACHDAHATAELD
jgi:hypothetical protein